MIKLLSEIKPRPFTCRQSCMACAMACERKWWYQYRMGITLRGTEYKEGATLGTIYHRLQCLGPGSEMVVKAEIAKQQQKLMDSVNRGEDLDGQTARLAGMLTTLYNKAVAMARIFWERYPMPDYLKVIGAEIKHTVEWNGLDLEGTMDKLLLDTKNGNLWIRDHKSTGMPSLEAIFGGLPWSIQGRMYRILAKDYCKKNEIEGKVTGFILDGIMKPGIKQCKTDLKNSKDWNVPIEEAYLRRVKLWYQEKEEDTLRSRGIMYTEHLFPEELVTALVKMKNLKSWEPSNPELFERDISGSECFAYMKPCIYHDLCKTDPKQWDSLFETKYKVIEEVKDEEIEKADL